MATIAADTSVIARDSATDAIASDAGTSPAAALEAMPYLLEILPLANGRFASRALHGPRLAVIARQSLPAVCWRSRASTLIITGEWPARQRSAWYGRLRQQGEMA